MVLHQCPKCKFSTKYRNNLQRHCKIKHQFRLPLARILAGAIETSPNIDRESYRPNESVSPPSIDEPIQSKGLRTSPVWNFYTALDVNRVSECLICGVQIDCSNHVTRKLLLHLRDNHPEEFEKAQDGIRNRYGDRYKNLATSTSASAKRHRDVVAKNTNDGNKHTQEESQKKKKKKASPATSSSSARRTSTATSRRRSTRIRSRPRVVNRQPIQHFVVDDDDDVEQVNDEPVENRHSMAPDTLQTLRNGVNHRSQPHLDDEPPVRAFSAIEMHLEQPMHEEAEFYNNGSNQHKNIVPYDNFAALRNATGGVTVSFRGPEEIEAFCRRFSTDCGTRRQRNQWDSLEQFLNQTLQSMTIEKSEQVLREMTAEVFRLPKTPLVLIETPQPKHLFGAMKQENVDRQRTNNPTVASRVCLLVDWLANMDQKEVAPIVGNLMRITAI